MSGFNMPPGVSARDIPGQDDPTDDGGPAFPVLPPCDMEGASAAGYPYPSAGISVRDYFAAAAMQAMVSQRAYPWDKQTPQYAYSVADAMLRERMKP